MAVNLTPNFAVCEISDDVSAPGAGSLMCNRQQMKDYCRYKDYSSRKAKDPLSSVMLMCKESQGAKASDVLYGL